MFGVPIALGFLFAVGVIVSAGISALAETWLYHSLLVPAWEGFILPFQLIGRLIVFF